MDPGGRDRVAHGVPAAAGPPDRLTSAPDPAPPEIAVPATSTAAPAAGLPSFTPIRRLPPPPQLMHRPRDPRAAPKPHKMIGQYVLHQTLGSGSFGKVKRTLMLTSRHTRTDGPPRCGQDHQQAQDLVARHWRTHQARNPVPQAAAPSAHHQALRGDHDAIRYNHGYRVRGWRALPVYRGAGPHGRARGAAVLPADHLGDRVLPPTQDRPPRPQAGEVRAC